MRILALSGTLCAASVNSSLLRVAARLVRSDVSVTVFDDAGSLPLFNPDRHAILRRSPRDSDLRSQVQMR